MSIVYLESARILDNRFGAVAPTTPANFYFALSTTTPTASGTNFTEPTTVSTGYARVLVANNKVSWGNASSGSLSNLIQISFPEALLDWGTVTYGGIYDSVTVGAGNLLYFGAFTPSKVIQAGTLPYFAIGSIVVSLLNA